MRQVIETASYLLKPHGRFYMVHIPERIDEIIVYAHENGLAVKNLSFVYSKEKEEPVLCLVTMMKGGKFGCRVSPSVIISNLDSYQNLFH